MQYFAWAVDAIQYERSAEAYGSLIAIHAIGDKLSVFYLRDIALVADGELDEPRGPGQERADRVDQGGELDGRGWLRPGPGGRPR